MRALVLSGGGSKGAYQVGVISQLAHEESLDYDIICGVSVGALNAAGLCQFKKHEHVDASMWLQHFWYSLEGNESVYSRWFPFGKLHSLWKHSAYDSRPIAKLVRNSLNKDRIANSGRILSVGAICLNSGEHKFARENDVDIIDWVLASSSYPIFFSPIEINGKLWSDGGLVNVTPLREAVTLGATHIDVIMCTDPNDVEVWNSNSKNAFPYQLIRCVDLMNSQIMKNDIELTNLKNKFEDYRDIKIRLFFPTERLQYDSLNFDKKRISEAMSLGRRDVIEKRYVEIAS